MEDFARKIKERTKEELNSGLDLPESESNTDSFGNPKSESRPSSLDSNLSSQGYQTTENNNSNQYQANSRDTELILAKLDAIKAEVSHINNRLENLERKSNERKKLW